jgi:hypothetical protein
LPLSSTGDRLDKPDGVQYYFCWYLGQAQAHHLQEIYFENLTGELGEMPWYCFFFPEMEGAVKR